MSSRRRVKDVLLIGVVLLLAIGAISGVVKLFEASDKTKVSPGAFQLGTLQDGKVIDSEKRLVMTDMIECQGLKIVPDFKSEVRFRVHFYDVFGEYSHSTDWMNAIYTSAPEDMRYCRVEILPDDGETLSLLDRTKYAKRITVTTNQETDCNVLMRAILDEPLDFSTGKAGVEWQIANLRKAYNLLKPLLNRDFDITILETYEECVVFEISGFSSSKAEKEYIKLDSTGTQYLFFDAVCYAVSGSTQPCCLRFYEEDITLKSKAMLEEIEAWTTYRSLDQVMLDSSGGFYVIGSYDGALVDADSRYVILARNFRVVE